MPPDPRTLAELIEDSRAVGVSRNAVVRTSGVSSYKIYNGIKLTADEQARVVKALTNLTEAQRVLRRLSRPIAENVA